MRGNLEQFFLEISHQKIVCFLEQISIVREKVFLLILFSPYMKVIIKKQNKTNEKQTNKQNNKRKVRHNRQ